jgi:SAM-dependent methyltransferase
MKLKQRLKDLYRKEMFIPSWISIVINSNYFVARGISQGIKRHRHYMKGNMLDFGCGRKPYRSLFAVGNHIGIDIENSAHGNETTAVDKFYNGINIPFDNEYFDSLFSSEVLTHVFNVEQIMAELNRVLKKGGCFLLTVPFVWKENEKPNDNTRFTSFGLKALLEKSGFEIIVQEKTGYYLSVAFQLFNDYLYSTLFPNVKVLKIFLTILIIFPLNLVGGVLTAVLPANSDLFFNNVIVAKKK